MSTNQILLGMALILVLAVGAQVAAERLRLPALILLLPLGFGAGALTVIVDPQRLLGAAFQPLVSLSVAVILYDAGLGLNLRELVRHHRRVVRRLIWLGVPVTMVIAVLASSWLLDLPRQSALMLGEILVVSGPTVVGPLLAAVGVGPVLRRILGWEGALIDPVGGILGAVVFSGLVASTHTGFGRQLLQFLGAARHRRRRDRVHLRRQPAGARDRWRAKDSARDIPGHCGHRCLVRPDRAAGGRRLGVIDDITEGVTEARA